MVQRSDVDTLIQAREQGAEDVLAVYWVPDTSVMRLIEVTDSPYATGLMGYPATDGLPPVAVLCLTSDQFEALKAEDAGTFNRLTDHRYTPAWPELGGAKILDIRGFTQVWSRGP